jgi:hypothetical protein
MNKTITATRVAGLLFLLSVTVVQSVAHAAPPTDPIPLWPGTAPGEKGDIGEEADTTKPGQDAPREHITRLGNVSKPTLTVFKPAADKDTGAAVVVCPGGAYRILAYELEGTVVC